MVKVFHPGGEPIILLVPEHELKGAGEVVQVLAGVIEIDDLGRFGEFRGGDVPDPGGAVAEDGELPDAAGAAADAFCFHEAREHAGGLEGGDVAG